MTAESGDLVEAARSWRATAERLLEESSLLEVLSDGALPTVAGAYRYDLMLTPDIDLHVALDGLDRRCAVDVLGRLIDQDWWNSYTFADWLQERFRLPQWQWLPKGIYIRLATDFAGNRWSVDVWLLDRSRYRGDRLAERMATISNAERLRILMLKDARNHGVIRSSGFDIYRAVLDFGIQTVEEFVDWQLHHAG